MGKRVYEYKNHFEAEKALHVAEKRILKLEVLVAELVSQLESVSCCEECPACRAEAKKMVRRAREVVA